MMRALRVISVERGLDPRDFALLAFGGAGGMHACALAEELGMQTVLVPRAGGVLSALGLAISDLRRDYVSPFLAALEEVEQESSSRGSRDMESTAEKDLDGPEHTRRADLRYRGQSFEITVEAGLFREAGGPLPCRARAALRLPHGRGGRRAREPAPDLHRPSRETGAGRARARRRGDAGDARPTSTASGWRWRCSTGKHGRGSEVAGPAIVEFRESTCVVRPGWRERWTASARWYWRRDERKEVGSGNPLGAGERPGWHSRGDGGSPDPGLLLIEHQGAARLLDGALRREGPDGRPGRAHARPPRGDARGGGCHHAPRPRAWRRLRHKRPVLRRHPSA